MSNEFPNSTLTRKRGPRMNREQRLAAQTTFLQAFAASGVVLVGCRSAGVDRSLVDYWNEHDARFNIAYGQARREADDRIRAEIQRRAVQGVTKRRTVTLDGAVQRTEEVTEFSDQLLMFLARSRMPEFKDREVVRLVFDEEALGVIVDIITRTVTDEETLGRLRSELARLAVAQPPA